MAKKTFTITVANRKHYKGDEYFKIDRTTPLGNPYRITESRTRQQAVEMYSDYMEKRIGANDTKIITNLNVLYNYLVKNRRVVLMCHCKPKLCHGDIIRQLLINKLHTGNYLTKEGTWH